MGYDLHVVRTRNWSDASRNPITRADVDELIASDPAYRWSVEDGRGTKGTESWQGSLEWREEFLAWWDKDGELNVKSPDEEHILRLMKLAESLQAMVVGDEDELYRVELDEDGKPELAWEQWDGVTGAYEVAAEEDRVERRGPARKESWLWKQYVRMDRVIYRLMNGVDRDR